MGDQILSTTWSTPPSHRANPSPQDPAVDVDVWSVSEYFDAEIEKLFRNILDHTYTFPSEPESAHLVHLQSAAESSLDFAVSTWNVQLVNTALHTVSKELGNDLHPARSWAPSRDSFPTYASQTHCALLFTPSQLVLIRAFFDNDLPPAETQRVRFFPLRRVRTFAFAFHAVRARFRSCRLRPRTCAELIPHHLSARRAGAPLLRPPAMEQW